MALFFSLRIRFPFQPQTPSSKRLRKICGKGVIEIIDPSSRSTLIRIPLPSSTLFLTTEEALLLLETLEAALPHSNHFEIAGEVLSGEQMQALLNEFKVMQVGGVPRPRGDWRKGF